MKQKKKNSNDSAEAPEVPDEFSYRDQAPLTVKKDQHYGSFYLRIGAVGEYILLSEA